MRPALYNRRESSIPFALYKELPEKQDRVVHFRLHDLLDNDLVNDRIFMHGDAAIFLLMTCARDFE